MPTQQFTQCPECTHSIPVDPQYGQWCEKCNWNVLPEPNTKLSRIDKIYDHLGKKLSGRIYHQLSKKPDFKIRLGFLRLFAFLFAVFVNSITVVLFTTGLYLMFTFWPNILVVMAGAFCVTASYFLLPARFKKPDNIVSKSEFPTLYAIMDMIAKKSKAKPLKGIVVNGDFNASIMQFGLKREAYMTIGLPLYYVLEPRELFGILSHEMGHCVNKDPT